MRKLIKLTANEGFFVDVDCEIQSVRLGSEYGGWVVHTEALNHKSIIMIFGVGEDLSFELELIEKTGSHIFAFDPTPKSVAWIERNSFPPELIFETVGLAAHDGTLSFSPPANPNHTSFSALSKGNPSCQKVILPVQRLTTIALRAGVSRIDLLKMDIEGSEYEVIQDLLLSNLRPRQILVEFHHRFSEIQNSDTSEAVQTLLDLGYRLFSVSDTATEFSFILRENSLTI